MPKQFTRREILAGTMGLCAGATLGVAGVRVLTKTGPPSTGTQAMTGPCGNQSAFNVILHGLFLVEIWDASQPEDQRVRVISLDCGQMTHPHEHMAGPWKSMPKSFPSKPPSTPGWKSNVASQPSFAALPVLKGFAGKIDPGKIYHSLSLPWPDAITPLRNVPEANVTHLGVGSPSTFPLALALTYCGGAPTSPLIAGCDWSKD